MICTCPRRYEGYHSELCKRSHMAYKDYVQKPITHELAPQTAMPKRSKGFSHAGLRKDKTRREFGQVPDYRFTIKRGVLKWRKK